MLKSMYDILHVLHLYVCIITFNMPCFSRFVVKTLCQMDVYPVCTFGFGISFLSQETIHQCGFAYAVVANKHASNEVIDVCAICQSL